MNVDLWNRTFSFPSPLIMTLLGGLEMIPLVTLMRGPHSQVGNHINTVRSLTFGIFPLHASFQLSLSVVNQGCVIVTHDKNHQTTSHTQRTPTRHLCRKKFRILHFSVSSNYFHSFLQLLPWQSFFILGLQALCLFSLSFSLSVSLCLSLSLCFCVYVSHACAAAGLIAFMTVIQSKALFI